MKALVEVMNLRINAVLREKLGLIYAGPEKVDQLVAALLAEIDSVRKDGPSRAELDNVKANWRQNTQRQQHENEYWLQNLQASLLDGTPPERLLTITAEMEKLTAADVRTAAQRYLDKDNYVQVVLLPEAGQTTAAGPSAP
jgi:zinc protease